MNEKVYVQKKVAKCQVSKCQDARCYAVRNLKLQYCGGDFSSLESNPVE